MLLATPAPVQDKNLRGISSGVARKARSFIGIVGDAKRLGVDRIHLWRVLTGKRQSRSLLERYRALKGES